MEDFQNNVAKDDGQGLNGFESQEQSKFEPVDKEDDPDLLVQRKSIRLKSPIVNPYKARRRVKRVSDELPSWADEKDHKLETREDAAPATRRFSVSGMGSPVRDFALKVQVFRKQQEKWLRLLPEVA